MEVISLRVYVIAPRHNWNNMAAGTSHCTRRDSSDHWRRQFVSEFINFLASCLCRFTAHHPAFFALTSILQVVA